MPGELVDRINEQMATEIRSPSKSGKYPAYSFQKPSLNTREQDIRDKIKSTKEELNEVLHQLNNDFSRSDHPVDLHASTANPPDDDDMTDLSPETRELMLKVLNKKEYKRQNTDEMNPLNLKNNKKQQL